MRKRIFASAVALMLIWTLNLQAQTVKAVLLGEGNDNIVKLMWLPGNWPQGLQTFIVKRRTLAGTTAGEWQNVAEKPIVPGLSQSKTLVNVDPSAREQARLQKKLADMIASGKAKEIPTKEYLKKLETDSNAIRVFPLVFALDYDMALLNGFALVDRDLPKAEAYEYGIFPVVNGKMPNTPITTYKWTYGTSPQISLAPTVTVKPNRKKNRIEADWTFDAASFKAQKLNGFNIYRKEKDSRGNYTRLNQGPIWPDLKGNAGSAAFTDSTVKEKTVYEYAVVPVTLFGTEGPYITVAYDPAAFVFEINPPVLNFSLAGNNERSLTFSWTFEAAQEKLMKGFVMERYEDAQKSFKEVSGMLPVADRSFTDTKNLKPGSYYRYRLAAVRTESEKIYSNEQLVFYNPQTPPPAPAGLTAKMLKENGKTYVLLNWNARSKDDTLTYAYRIYSSFPPDNKLAWETNLPLITANQYKYELFNARAARYSFAVSAISRTKEESGLSNTAEVISPTTQMPLVILKNASLDSNRVSLSWKYEDLPDLKGFRVYMNGNLLVDADKLGAQSRQWTSSALQEGQTYTFELQGVSASGLASTRSYPIKLTVQKRQKK